MTNRRSPHLSKAAATNEQDAINGKRKERKIETRGETRERATVNLPCGETFDSTVRLGVQAAGVPLRLYVLHNPGD